MTVLHFKVADAIVDREMIVRINIEYMEWVATGMEASCGVSIVAVNGQSIADYVEGSVDKVCAEKPPRGIFYLLRQDDEVIGMVGLRSLCDDVAEIKRLYVREAFRGQHVGTMLLNKVIGDAKAFGYARVRLDSAPFMKAAQQLYRSAGFVDRAPYSGTEVPLVLQAQWHFMELNFPDQKCT